MAPNRFNISPLRIVLFVGIIIACIVAFFTLQHLQSRRTIEIKFENVSEVKLVEFRTLKLVEVVKNSGDIVTIDKSVRYKLTYTGSDGFTSGDVAVDANKDTFTIKPYYSVEKLDSLLTDGDITSIHNEIKNKYIASTLDQYTIDRGQLYHYGYWYSTALIYKQGYSNISDTLYVIAKKTARGWEIVADPDITFDRFNNPSIPVDILQAINAQSS